MQWGKSLKKGFMMTPLIKRTTAFGLLLAACVISLAMQPLPASAHNNNAPRTVTTSGQDTHINRNLPGKVVLLPTVTSVILVAPLQNDSSAITNGDLYSWRSEFTGQLGNGSFGLSPYGSSNAGPMLPLMALADKKDGGGSGKDAICTYLYSVITYPYADIVIKLYALSLYRSYGCQPAL